jgi:hypothetical protein
MSNETVAQHSDVFAKLSKMFNLPKVTGLSSEELWFQVGRQVFTLSSVKESKTQLRSMLSQFEVDGADVLPESIKMFSLRIDKKAGSVWLEQDEQGVTLGSLEELRTLLNIVV